MSLSAVVLCISAPDLTVTWAREQGWMAADTSPNAAPLDVPEAGYLCLATLNGWSLLLADLEDMAPHMETLVAQLPEMAVQHDLFFGVLQGAAGAVHFEWFTAGELRRIWTEAEGEVMEDEGQPLPAEHGLVKRDEHEGGPLHHLSTVLTLVQRLMGVSPADWEQAQGLYYPVAG